MKKMSISSFSWGAFGCLILLAVGCGGKDDGRVAVYPVSGQVLVNGQPAGLANVAFIPQTPELQVPGIPVPTATTDESGNFQLESYGNGDGAPAGEYKVTVVWPAPPPPNASGVFDLKDRLNGRYATPDRSNLAVTVEEKTNELPPFELK